MKMLIAMTAFLMSSAAFAAIPNCPRGSYVALNCVSTPQKGDYDVAADAFDAIQICRKGNDQAWMIASLKDDGEREAAQIEMRMGGTTYSVQKEDVIFSLSVPVIPGDEIKGTFSLKMVRAKIKVSSTYTCKQ